MFDSASTRRLLRGVAVCLLVVGTLGARANQPESMPEQEWPAAVEEILSSESSPEDYPGPIHCLHFGAYTNVEVINGELLLFRDRGDGTWLNPLRQACVGLRESEALVFQLRDSRVCEFDTVGGAHRLSGQFQPAGMRCSLGVFYRVSPTQVKLLENELSQRNGRKEPTEPAVSVNSL